jgi:hypothetical protein
MRSAGTTPNPMPVASVTIAAKIRTRGSIALAAATGSVAGTRRARSGVAEVLAQDVQMDARGVDEHVRNRADPERRYGSTSGRSAAPRGEDLAQLVTVLAAKAGGVKKQEESVNAHACLASICIVDIAINKGQFREPPLPDEPRFTLFSHSQVCRQSCPWEPILAN